MAIISMAMNRSIYIMIMTVMMFLSSCFVKEYRDDCPCWMTVEMPGQVGHDSAVILRLHGNYDEGAMDYAYKVSESIKADVGILEYEVPRGSVGVSVVNSARLVVPVGEQMDSLYGFSKMYHTMCESVKCDIELHKEFCTVSFTLVDEGYSSPYEIEVWGNVAGVSVWDLMPVKGDFRYAPVQKNGVYQVRVPRQEDNSLELVMLEIPGQAGYDGERAEDDDERVVVDRLPLGEYIARSGYDWATDDLADVHIALDMEKQQVMITVSGWDGVVVMDIVI